MSGAEGLIQDRIAVGLRDGAKLMGLGENAIFTAIREGWGPKTFRAGRRHLVRVVELERWACELEGQGGGGGDGQ